MHLLETGNEDAKIKAHKLGMPVITSGLDPIRDMVVSLCASSAYARLRSKLPDSVVGSVFVTGYRIEFIELTVNG